MYAYIYCNVKDTKFIKIASTTIIVIDALQGWITAMLNYTVQE